MSNFFEIDYCSLPGCWHLDVPIEKSGKEIDDVWAPTAGRRLDEKSFHGLTVPIQYEGTPLDFTLAAFNIPIVTKSLGDGLAKICPDDIQLIPVKVAKQRKKYYFLVTTKIVSCFDFEGSEWDGDEDNPKNVAGVWDLKIDTKKIRKPVQLFRIREWKIPIIINDVIRSYFDRKSFSGLEYRSV